MSDSVQSKRPSDSDVILFVDDEQVILDWLCDACSEDYSVRTARNGEEALKILESETVSVIVTDQRMPRMSGVELLSIVQERHPDTVRLLMTAFRGVDDVIEAVNKGHIYQFITKPLKLVELHQILDRALRYQKLAMENLDLTEELREVNRNLEKKIEERTVALEEKNRELHNHVLQSERMAQFSKRINLLNYERLFQVLTREIPSVLPIDLFSVYQVKTRLREDGEDEEVLVCLAHNHPYGVNKEEILLKDLDPGIMRDVIETRVPIMVKNFAESSYSKDREERSKYLGHSCCSLPLMIEDNLIAVINLSGGQNAIFNEDHFSLFNHVGENLASALSNCALYLKTQQLAITDGLTRLYNIGYFLERLEEEIQRSYRFATPLSCIMIDLDFFKRINDRFGHDEGNTVLKDVSRILIACKRQIDLLARFGGEEFIISLPGTDREGAIAVARRIREQIRNHPFELRGEKIRITASVGVATLNGESADKDNLIRMADMALYRAKEEGRDRVEFEDQPPVKDEDRKVFNG